VACLLRRFVDIRSPTRRRPISIASSFRFSTVVAPSCSIPRLVAQLCQLERHAGSAKDNIKPPPGGHDDVVNATAGAIVTALTVVAQEVTSFPMPFVASSGPRYFPGSPSQAYYYEPLVAPTTSGIAPLPSPSSPSSPGQPAPRRPFVNGLSDVPRHVRDSRPAHEPWRDYVTSTGEILPRPRGRWDNN
jgi:hypothetical protein